MRNLLITALLAAALAGCAATLPTCDGRDRRPVNAPARADIIHPSCGSAA